MSDMNILEYVVFADKVSDGLKEKLKNIYLNEKGGKEAVIVPWSNAIQCVIDVCESSSTNGIRTFENWKKTVIAIDLDGEELDRKSEYYSKEIELKKMRKL